MDPRIPNNVSAVEEDKITLEALREEHEMRRAVVFFFLFPFGVTKVANLIKDDGLRRPFVRLWQRAAT